MAFPSNPANLQTHTEYSRSYQYFSDLGIWVATRGAWDYAQNDLDLSNISGTGSTTLDNGVTYTPITVPYVVTNRVWQSTNFDPPSIPPPTVAITGTTSNLIESSTRSFVVYLTDDHNNTASLNIVSGGGSLGSNTISNGNSVIYTPTNVASNTSVTLRATVADIRGNTATSDISFTVADTPAATVAISGNTNFMEADSSRGFTVSHSGDLDGNIQVSIIGGQGTLSHSSRTNGQIVTYTNPSYFEGDVTIRARAINYDGEITDATVVFPTAATNPTVSITGSTSQLAYDSSRDFTANHTFDSDNSIGISIVTGSGTLDTSSVANGGTFTYSGGSHSGAVAIRATAENYAGETVTSDMSFDVATRPPQPITTSQTLTAASFTDTGPAYVVLSAGGGGGGAAIYGLFTRGNASFGGSGGSCAFYVSDISNLVGATLSIGAGGSGARACCYPGSYGIARTGGTGGTSTLSTSSGTVTVTGGGGGSAYSGGSTNFNIPPGANGTCSSLGGQTAASGYSGGGGGGYGATNVQGEYLYSINSPISAQAGAGGAGSLLIYYV